MKTPLHAACALTLLVAATLAHAGQGSQKSSPESSNEVPLNQAMDNPNWQNLTGESPELRATKSPLPKKKTKKKKKSQAHT